MHYLFLWRYYAGAAAVVFLYLLYRMLEKALADRSADALALSIFMVMMAVGGPTHALIKFRPMKSVPILGSPGARRRHRRRAFIAYLR
jgi:hypothetical protein